MKKIEHDTENAQYNSMIPIDDNKFMLAYRTGSSDGNLKFFTVPDDGSSITENVSYEHDTNDGGWNVS